MYGDLKRPPLAFSRIIAWMTVCFLVLPILVVIPVSFTPKRYLSWPGADWSLRHYQSLTEDNGWTASLGDSLIVATLAAILALILGTLFAVGNWRLNHPFTRNLRIMMLLPMIVPPIVHAVAFYKAWAVLSLLDTFAGLVLVHTMKGAAVRDPVSVGIAGEPGPPAGTGFTQSGGECKRNALVCSAAADPTGIGRGCDLCLHHQLGRDHRRHLHHQSARLHPAETHLGRHFRQCRPGHRCDWHHNDRPDGDQPDRP